MDEHKFFNSSIYRLINVLAFFAYAFIILLTLLAAYLGYGERRTISATLVCKDGTTWDAINIQYDSASKCGLCTKRMADNQRYDSCKYDDPEIYSSNEVKVEKESFSWNAVIYPIIVFLVGTIIVDVLKISLFYIFSGRLLVGSSLLVILIKTFNGNDEQ